MLCPGTESPSLLSRYYEEKGDEGTFITCAQLWLWLCSTNNKYHFLCFAESAPANSNFANIFLVMLGRTGAVGSFGFVAK